MTDPLILLTNDDGFEAAGLRRLRDAAWEIGEVVVVAPDRQRSAIGHAITLNADLRVAEIDWDERGRVFSCSGTPADCVMVAVHGLLARRPDLVLSGINEGLNLGEDLTYSGTVCAAMEGCLMGVPSVALSAGFDSEPDRPGFETAARIAPALARLVLRHGLPRGTFLNVNVPPVAPQQVRGVSITHLGSRAYALSIERSLGSEGEQLFRINGGPTDRPGQRGTDIDAVSHQRISITPVSLDMTAADQVDDVERWPTEVLMDALGR